MTIAVDPAPRLVPEPTWGDRSSNADFDLTISAIFNDENLSDQVDSTGAPDDGQALVFTIKKVW